MTTFFRKSIKILPGVRINFGKKSTSVSIGPRGAKITTGTKGTHVSVGVPGTGVYYKQKVSAPKKRKSQGGAIPPGVAGASGGPAADPYNEPLRTKAANQTWGYALLVLAVVLFLIAVSCNLLTIGRFFIGGVGAFCVLSSVAFFTSKSVDDTEEERQRPSREVNKFALVFGVLIVMFCLCLFVSSLSWNWVSHSKTNIYITHDLSFLKWLLYPFLLVLSVVGLLFVRMGFSRDEK